MKLARRSKSSRHRKCGPKTLAAFADKKDPALAFLRDGFSAGWVARKLELTEQLVTHWRDEAGISPCKPGKCRPMPGKAGSSSVTTTECGRCLS